MKPMLRRLLFAALAILFAGLSVGHTFAEGGKAIRVVITVPPGGTIDYLVRVLADHIAKSSGQIGQPAA